MGISTIAVLQGANARDEMLRRPSHLVSLFSLRCVLGSISGRYLVAEGQGGIRCPDMSGCRRKPSSTVSPVALPSRMREVPLEHRGSPEVVRTLGHMHTRHLSQPCTGSRSAPCGLEWKRILSRCLLREAREPERSRRWSHEVKSRHRWNDLLTCVVEAVLVTPPKIDESTTTYVLELSSIVIVHFRPTRSTRLSSPV